MVVLLVVAGSSLDQAAATESAGSDTEAAEFSVGSPLH